MAIQENTKNEILKRINKETKAPNQSNSDRIAELRGMSNSKKSELGKADSNQEEGIFSRVVDRIESESRGLAKSGLRSAEGLFQIGKSVADAVNPTTGTAENLLGDEITEEIQSERDGEQVGSLVGDIAQFALPGGAVSKATNVPKLVKGAGVVKQIGNVFKKALPQSITSGSVASAQEGEVGEDTLIAAGTELGFPLLGKILSKTVKGGKRLGEEILGTLSGTSQETLETAYREAMDTQESRNAFAKALRSETTEEEIVNTIRNSVDEISAKRSAEYGRRLSELGDTQVNTSNVAKDFIDEVSESFGIKIDKEGGLDFSGSRLRSSPQARNKLLQTYQELSTLQSKGTTNVKDIDTTRQAIQDIALQGDDASARVGNAIIAKASNKVADIGKQVDGYGEMLSDFSQSKEFTDAIAKSLSTGDKKTVDQTYRRVVTAFKTNNEARKTLVEELDKISDGFISAKITGQQLSEIMPRGIVGRMIAPVVGTGAIASGGLNEGDVGTTAGLVALLALSSPKLIGETINALGLTKQKTQILRKVFSESQDVIANTLGVRKQDILNAVLTKKD